MSIFHGAPDLSRRFSASILVPSVTDQDQHRHIDKPEPRWQALAAFLAVGGIYLALPANLIIGPIWLLPTLIVVLLVPTVVSHKTGRRSLNRTLGIVINGITTIALIGSVVLLVRALPSHRVSSRCTVFSQHLSVLFVAPTVSHDESAHIVDLCVAQIHPQ